MRLQLFRKHRIFFSNNQEQICVHINLRMTHQEAEDLEKKILEGLFK